MKMKKEANDLLPMSLSEFLQKCNRKIVPILGDGNCLFRALSHQLFNTEEHHGFIRLLMQRFENLNSEIFSPFLMSINKPTIKDHIRHIGIPSTWGTHIEVLAVATYFKMPVYIACATRNFLCIWQVVKPLQSKLSYPILSQDDRDMPEMESINHFEIAHHSAHYDSIVSTTSGNATRTEPELPFQHNSIPVVIDITNV